MNQRAKHSDAYNYLYIAKNEGVIKSFERVKVGNTTKYKIIVPSSTRFDHYHNPEATGEILLTVREVMAFTEGWWAARNRHPVHRAGETPWYAQRHRFSYQEPEPDEEEDDTAVDITDQRELPETVEGTVEED